MKQKERPLFAVGDYVEVFDEVRRGDLLVCEFRPARVIAYRRGVDYRGHRQMILRHDNTCLTWWNDKIDSDCVRPARPWTRLWYQLTVRPVGSWGTTRR